MGKPQPLLQIVLFGGTGDLSKKKLIPALFYLYQKKLLPPFELVAIARQPLTNAQYQQLLSDAHHIDDLQTWQGFLNHVSYLQGDSEQDELYQQLAQQFNTNKKGDLQHRLFYLATLPKLYEKIAGQLRFHHLTTNPNGWSRLLIEKPFGMDVASSRLLNRELLAAFPEADIFRVDHFLAKETVQNILAFRFANGVFENLWHQKFIEHIQVTSAEPFGVEGRERFYNGVGVVRDVIQNHVLSLLAIALMEEPASFDPRIIQQERLRLLSRIEVPEQELLADRVKFGRYQTDNLSPLSPEVPTAVALRLQVINDRWQSVPIFIRAGKKMPTRITELSVVFKEPVNSMFTTSAAQQLPNVLTFRIQPNEGIILRVNNKRPGLDYDLEPISMSFCYSSSFVDTQLPEAYSKVIFDAIRGDTTLFLDAEGVDASWAAVEPLLRWQAELSQVPEPYQAATWGPDSFSQLLTASGRTWLEPDLAACSLR